MKDYDIVIVGGGIVGMLAALATAKTNRNIAIIDAKEIAPAAVSDKINLVINSTSLEVLSALGLGDIMASDTVTIDNCIISAKGHFGRVRIRAKDLNKDCLGKTIAVDLLRNRLIKRLQEHKNITCFSGCELDKISCASSGERELHYKQAGGEASIATKLLLAADGANSIVRKLSNIGVVQESIAYAAVLFHVTMDAPISAAYQRFLSPGSIALIPGLENKACIIWTLPQQKAQARVKLELPQLISLAQHDLGKSVGKILGVCSAVMSYPLTMQRAEKSSLPGLLLLGSVANQLLPITAQGLNLAIRDIAVMQQVLEHAGTWDDAAAQRYNLLRVTDHNHNYQQINYLVRLFSRNSIGISILRSLGLATFGASSALAARVANIGFGNINYDFAARVLDI